MCTRVRIYFPKCVLRFPHVSKRPTEMKFCALIVTYKFYMIFNSNVESVHYADWLALQSFDLKNHLVLLNTFTFLGFEVISSIWFLIQKSGQ